jgi:SAM-dependent methyltransferase
MFSLFKRSGSAAQPPVRTRHSRGWAEIHKHLREHTEPLRVLDFGATSSGNINLLTSLGHGVYMANTVEEAWKPEWLTPVPEGARKGTQPEFDAERFADANLNFSGRDFDVILLWDTADYLPPALTPVLFQRLRDVLRTDGRVLAFFHGKKDGVETGFARYQLAESDELRLTPVSGNFTVQQIIQNRQIERFMEGFSSTRFFSSADSMREVIGLR